MNKTIKTASLISIIFLGVLCLTRSSSAAVRNAASCAKADVQAAVTSAVNGDTVTIPAGNCTWSSTLTINKGITLQGAGTNATTITQNSGIFSIVINLNADLPVRVTGIYFDLVSNSSSDHGAIEISGSDNGSFGTTQLRIDHCKFNKGNAVISPEGWVYGVIDHN